MTTGAPCPAPLSLEELVAYRMGELHEDAEAKVEAHFFGCSACTERLDRLSRLHAAIIEIVHQGRVRASITTEMLRRIREAGLQVRAYTLAPGERILCTAAPTDDFLVVHLTLDADPTETLDLTIDGHHLETNEHQAVEISGVLRDPATRQLVLLFPGDLIRSYPRSLWRYQIRARSEAGARSIGPYLMDHTPWEQLPHP